MAELNDGPLSEYRLSLKRILSTYGELDHTLSLAEACRQTRARVIADPGPIEAMGAIPLGVVDGSSVWVVPEDDPKWIKHSPVLWALSMLDFTLQLPAAADVLVSAL